MFRFFRKEILFILFFCILGLNSYAAVTRDTNSRNVSSVQEKNCYGQGYKKTSCPKGSIPKDRCATNERYFKSCVCDREVYKYSRNNCDKSTGASLKGSSCSDENGEKSYKSCKCNSSFRICQSGFVTGSGLCIDDDGFKYNVCIEDIPTCESINYLSYVPRDYKCTEVKNQYMVCYKDCMKI